LGYCVASVERIADAVLRTLRDKIAKIDDNAEEGVKTQESDRALPTAFRGCHRKSITGILLVLYLTVPGSGSERSASPQQA
jgi:hypothetical protein